MIDKKILVKTSKCPTKVTNLFQLPFIRKELGRTDTETTIRPISRKVDSSSFLVTISLLKNHKFFVIGLPSDFS